jgi:hypothetical protein
LRDSILADVADNLSVVVELASNVLVLIGVDVNDVIPNAPIPMGLAVDALVKVRSSSPLSL